MKPKLRESMRFFLLMIVPLFVLACADKSTVSLTPQDLALYDIAEQNGEKANEGYNKCRRFMEAWILEADPKTGLIPRNLDQSKDIWNAKDAAADNYPFMVLTSFFVDQGRFEGRMLDMLNTEKALTSRLGSLPDTYSFSSEGFLNEEINKDEIVFGASEYIKDGLLPLTEWLGQSPWSERMIAMIYDLKKEVAVAQGVGVQGYGNAPREEVNGELLQVLSRIYWMTGDEELLDWAIEIGDFYLLGDHHPTRNLEYLRLRDHGCELISGLCELYISTHFARKDKNKEYKEPLYEMLDRILDVGRNVDGFFYDAVNPITGEIIESRIADTWGYTLNGYYGIFMIDGTERYKNAVLKVFSNLDKYRNHNWEGNADGYADAIESALNLYNRIPDETVAKWIDSEIQVMWGMQQESGIIEGWHGDGNFARTTIMHNLWKSQGLYLMPWREDIKLGAVSRGDTLFVKVSEDSPWSGKLCFDKKRHESNMHLPIDWPRINQFPEWFVANPEKNYQIHNLDDNKSYQYPGMKLIEGIELDVDSVEQLVVL